MSDLDSSIFHAAVRLLVDEGHRGATTRKIAHAAGVSQSSIFRVFGDKDNLLHTIFTRLHPDGKTTDLSPLLAKEDIAGGLAYLLQEYLTNIIDYFPAVRLSMQLAGRPDFMTDPDAALSPYVDQLACHLDNLYAQHRIVQADFRALAQLVFSALLAHAPEMADGGRDEELMNRLSWKYALFLEDRLKTGRNNVGAATTLSRKRESRSSDIRENNLRAVLRTFVGVERLSAPDVQKEVRLSKTTTIKLIAQLLDDGLLLDLGVDNNIDERGRPPSYYCLNGDFAYGVVVQFVPESILTAVTNLKNEIIHVHATPITDQLTFEEALSIIVDSFHHVIRRQGIAEERVLGLCVATGGPTSEADGTIAYLPRYHNWPKHAPLGKRLRERLPSTVNIIANNEMYCQTVGEQYFGKAYGKRSALVFEAGEKLGSGIIMDDRLLLGAHSIAGEIGHIKLAPHSDVKCVCGSYGCFRALVHSDRIVSLARDGLAKHPDSILRRHAHPTVMNVFNALEAGDRLATGIMEEMAQWMGVALSNLILTIDPEIIVLQGIYSKAGPIFLEMVRRHVVQDKFPYLGELNLTVEYSALEGKACLLGGSKLITEYILDQYCKQG